MIITRSAHEAALERLVGQLDALGLHESAGIHGPQSKSWQVNATVINFLGAGRAILLQLAHPYVAYAIAEHSTTVSDVRSRFRSTFENVYQMTFGTRSDALASARQVHAVHARIHGVIPEAAGRFEAGHRYHGNDPGALLWVHTTLIHTAGQVQELTGAVRSLADKEELYEQSKRFALLFGLGPDLVPETLEDFNRYFDDQIQGDTLTVSPPALEMADFILQAPTPSLEPVFTTYRALTASLLPERIRVAYGLSFGRKERVLAALVMQSARRVGPRLPAGLRLVPAAMEAEARLGLRHVGPWSRLLDRSMQATLGVWG
jgi:uncharacterized protein (DUF2236 family)